MLVFNLRRVMTVRGIDKPHAFLVRHGFSRQTASALINDHVKQVKVGHLGSLCRLLQCTPSDLFEWQAERDDALGEKHPLNALRRTEPPAHISEMVSDFSLEQLEKLQTIISDLKNES